MNESSYVLQGSINGFNNNYNTFSLFDFVTLDTIKDSRLMFNSAHINLLEELIDNKNETKLIKTKVKTKSDLSLYMFGQEKNITASLEETEKFLEKETLNNSHAKHVYTLYTALYGNGYKYFNTQTNLWWDFSNNTILFVGNEKTAEAFSQAFNGSVEIREAKLKIKNITDQKAFEEYYMKKREEYRQNYFDSEPNK